MRFKGPVLVAFVMSAMLAWSPTVPKPSVSAANGVPQGDGLLGFHVPAPPTEDCVPPALRAEIERNIAEYEARNGVSARQGGAKPYRFVPHGGTIWQDLFVNNFTDLDLSSGIRDWDCTDFTYDGHHGHDIDLRSFREQDIGVPIFAALDGTVIDAHDGEFDQNTQFNSSRANYVILDHGGTHQTWYLHMKKGSVAVRVGQTVKAGAQLGLTGSSGNSTGPHLHFESRLNGTWFEPSAGRCRSGESNWTAQTPIRRDTYLRDFCFSAERFDAVKPFPFDDAARANAFVSGIRSVYFRIQVTNLPARSTYRVRFKRPDGSIALDDQRSIGFSTEFYRQAWAWWGYSVNLNQPGTWTLTLDLNNQTVAESPFEVGASAPVANRPPRAITVALDPPAPTPNDVIFCRVTTNLAAEDPDYDIVRYRYVWSLNKKLIRDVVSSGLADAIPAGEYVPGEELVCTVTPSDGKLDGPSATARHSPAPPSDTTAPTVRVTAPNGGESVKSGDVFTISWQSSDDTGVTSHDLGYENELSAAPAPIPIVSGLSGSAQGFAWEIKTNAVIERARVHVRARDAAGNLGFDISDAPFSINATAPPPDTTPPLVRVVAPNGGEKLRAGATFMVTWQSSDDRGLAAHEVRLSTDGGVTFPTALAVGLPGTAQSFAFGVPATKTKTGRIRVTARDTAGNLAQDDGDGNFQIKVKK